MHQVHESLSFYNGAQGLFHLPFWCPVAARFLEALGLSFDILNLVGQFFYYCHQVLVGGGKFGVLAVSCSSNDFLLIAAAARLFSYLWYPSCPPRCYRCSSPVWWSWGPSWLHLWRQTCPTLQRLVLLRALWCAPSCNWSSIWPRFFVPRIDFPVVVVPWVSLSSEHLHARKLKQKIKISFIDVIKGVSYIRIGLWFSLYSLT